MNAILLKIIALLAMSIDHIGYIFKIDMFRFIGRIAFPIYVFLLVNGYYHTKNKYKYMFNLFIFALLSEIPFDLFTSSMIIDTTNNNIFITLLIGLVMIYVVDLIKDKTDKYLSYVFSFLTVILFALINELVHADYGFIGIIIIFIYYLAYNVKDNKIYYLLGLIFSSYVYIVTHKTLISIGFIISIPLLFFYNNKNIKLNKYIKYFFYLYYPFHLLVLYLIKLEFYL